MPAVDAAGSIVATPGFPARVTASPGTPPHDCFFNTKYQHSRQTDKGKLRSRHVLLVTRLLMALSSPCVHRGHTTGAHAVQLRDDGSLVKVHGRDLDLVRDEQQPPARRREASGRDNHGHDARLATADARARADQRVCARRGVPYADTAAVGRGYEGGPVVGIGNTVDGAGVDAG